MFSGAVCFICLKRGMIKFRKPLLKRFLPNPRQPEGRTQPRVCSELGRVKDAVIGVVCLGDQVVLSLFLQTISENLQFWVYL